MILQPVSEMRTRENENKCRETDEVLPHDKAQAGVFPRSRGQMQIGTEQVLGDFIPTPVQKRKETEAERDSGSGMWLINAQNPGVWT